MARLRILIVDDEPLAIERLQVLLATLDEVEIVGTAQSYLTAREAIAALRPELVLLDIQMPGGSGMALAADLRMEDRPEIIFVTAFENFAPDAFAVDAADYVVKPVRFDRLRQAITRAQMRIRLARLAGLAGQVEHAVQYLEEIWVPMRQGHVRVPVDMIEWIEAAKDYAILHTGLRSYLYRMSMNGLGQRLDPAELMRVHRSAFVRPTLVDRIERAGKGGINLVLRDGVSVQVGPSYQRDVLRRLLPDLARQS